MRDTGNKSVSYDTVAQSRKAMLFLLPYSVIQIYFEGFQKVHVLEAWVSRLAVLVGGNRCYLQEGLKYFW